MQIINKTKEKIKSDKRDEKRVRLIFNVNDSNQIFFYINPKEILQNRRENVFPMLKSAIIHLIMVLVYLYTIFGQIRPDEV
jgi:hypothetical protein